MAGLDAVDDENFGVEDAAEDTAEDTAEEAVDLSVYGDAGVRAALKERNRLAVERQKYYDALTAKITAQRAGPSFSERMYQLSAALAAPTTTRGFSGVMGNVMPVLQKQQQAQREGEVKRQDALNALQAAQLNQRAGSAQQDVTTALAMAKLNQPKPPVGVDVGGVLRDRSTNQVIGEQFNRVPKPEYYKALEAAPTPENLQAAVAYYPTFAVDLKAAYERGLRNKGR